ncbi:MAG TPA: phospholipid scramblase-related protein [Acidimicrobiia bacterium]|nr:phospholipid scramblase-related protein [Acidimicrobiia bacterium]
MKLFEHAQIVISQKAKVIELTNEYKISDPEGREVGVIRQEGQTALKKVARFVSSLDQFMTHTLGVYDETGSKVMQLTRPRKIVKSSLKVTDGTGADVGSIRQQNVFGKIRFGLHDAAGNEIGQIQAENWRAWNFAIVDTTGTEVGRITKTWEGFAKTLFTTADNYLLDISPKATGTLRLLAFASAVGVDTALKQDERGLN